MEFYKLFIFLNLAQAQVPLQRIQRQLQKVAAERQEVGELESGDAGKFLKFLLILDFFICYLFSYSGLR